MSSLAPWVPVQRSTADGYVMIKDFGTLIKQNLKNLILTAPGERMMDPAFGVGLRNFLFEQNTQSNRSIIEDRIYNQVQIYMPFVQVMQAQALAADNNHSVQVRVTYRVPDLNSQDMISLDVSLKNSSI